MLKLGRNSLHCVFFNSSFKWVSSGYATSSIYAERCEFTVDYFVNSLGFSKEEALLASYKVNPFKYPANPNSVLNFLRANGFNDTQIKRIVLSTPKILSYDVNKTLRPKLEAFHEFGLSGSDLADVVTTHCHIFSRSLDMHIVPTLRMLKSIFEDDLMLKEALKKLSFMLSSGLPKTLPGNVALLKDSGLSMEQIRQLFVRKSKCFLLEPEWLQTVLVRVEEKFGIPRHSPMFVRGVYALCGMSDKCLELKLEIFRSFGWGEADIRMLAKNNPHVLALSESKLKSSLSFAMKELGFQPAQIASCTNLLSLSLERRVIPRNAVVQILKDKGLVKPDYRLCSCLVLTDAKFFDRFVRPFKDEVLDLYNDYRKRGGYDLESGD